MGSILEKSEPVPAITKEKNLILLGDSTLDNIVWVKGGPSIKQQLEKLMPQYNVINLACDGFTTQNMLKGGSMSISYKARQKSGDPFPEASQFSSFKPLNHLKEKVQLKDNNFYCVLSIGGNDIRIILGEMEKLQLVMTQLVQNYKLIVDRILEYKNIKLILQFQYKPSKKDDFYHVYQAMKQVSQPGKSDIETLNELMRAIYSEIFKIAREKKLPIIDLPRSFNCMDSSLYESQIEPSVKGGEKISQLINHIVSNHNFEGDSIIYYEQEVRREQGEKKEMKEKKIKEDVKVNIQQDINEEKFVWNLQ